MVTYANLTHKVTLLGDMFGGSEEWTTGFFLGDPIGGDEGTPPSDAEAQAIAERFRTMFVTANLAVHNQFRFLGAKVSYVDTNGKSDPSFTKYHYLPTPAVGAYGGGAFPPQISLVATLVTNKARGYGSKGRMYLPGIAAGIGADGKLGTTFTGIVSGLVANFLNDVNNDAAVPGVVILNSAASTGIPGHAAESNPVTSVRVGTVYDTQRRRRNALTEQYSATPLPG